MRLDKYLKETRIIKRRTVSKDIISFGQVKVNDRLAKPSTGVEINDLITLQLGHKIITIKVLKITDKTRKEDAINLYEIVNESNIEPSSNE